tara:strand:- start:1785 stop:2063 length:279 start_codon:yes stop_codon:yes gene_type:complete
MGIELVKVFDGRNVEEVFSGKPRTLKVEYIDARGITYFGWTKGGEYRFFQSSLPTGKKCQRKVSDKITIELIQLINDHLCHFKITDWYYWKK